MANLTIRNLDDAVTNQLNAQARMNGRSLEGEVHYILKRETSTNRRLKDFARRSRELAALTVGTHETDSTILIREDGNR